MPARLLIFSSDDSNIRYATNLNISDPFIYVKLDKEYVILSSRDYSLAKREVKAGIKIILFEDVDVKSIRKPVGRKRNLADIAAAFLLSYNATEVLIPENFWTGHFQVLQEHGLRPRIEAPFWPKRLVKTEEEIKHIKATGMVAKKAFKHALNIIKEASVEWNDTLTYKGTRITSEWLRNEIESILLMNDCFCGQTIVACGEQSAEPHNRGSGPLYAGRPIIIDLFPRSSKTGYYFDMTRTIIKGTPSKELRRLYTTVQRAQKDALAIVAPGKVKHIHEACVDVFHRAGYLTSEEEGFIHSTGHSLGLDIHEAPRINSKSEDELKPGYVVTIEPGLYYKEHGGIRIEDTVLVTKDGHVNLTNIPKTLIVP